VCAPAQFERSAFLGYMKKFAFTSLKIFFLLIFVGIANSCFDVSSQSWRMHEVENKSQTNRQASAETLAVFREFFAYVQTYEPSIATDEIAQNRWLTKRMRKAFVEHIGRSGNPEGNPDYPTNATFVLV